MHAPRTPFRRLAPLLFLALPAAFFDLACHKSEATAAADKPAARPATKVTLAAATKASIPDDTSVTGTILADREAMVAADAVGKVLEIAVQRGAVVKKGDVLARLDTRGANFSAEMARAQAAVPLVDKGLRIRPTMRLAPRLPDHETRLSSTRLPPPRAPVPTPPAVIIIPASAQSTPPGSR